MSELQERGVSNNGFFRQISNELDDNLPKFKDSSSRAFIHGTYHTLVGVAKFCVGNGEGANAEFGRAGEQYTKAVLGLPGEYGD